MHQDKKGMIISSLGIEEDFIEEVRFEVDNWKIDKNLIGAKGSKNVKDWERKQRGWRGNCLFRKVQSA